MKTRYKILISILFIICLFLLKNVNSVKATTETEYRWPIGGNNANETYIDYEYYGQAGEEPIKDGKSGREYKVNNEIWPDEQPYYCACESHFGMDITGINGQTYKVVSVVEGTVLETSATYAQNRSTNYQDRNQRATYGGLNDGGGYGNYIIIQETSTGRCFLYGHLKGGSFKVSRGDKVTVGQEIATMGSSGDSGHMHLHFEIRKSKEVTINYWNYATGEHRLCLTNSKTNLDPKDYIGSSPKNIKEISLIKPQKTQYIQDTDELDLSGAKIQVKYNSGITSEIELPNNNVKVTGFDNSKIGENTITLEYEGEKLSFNIQIVAKPITPAKRKSVKFMRYNKFRQINIYFDKPIVVEEAPTLTVRVENETKVAKYVGLYDNNKKMIYRISYSEFDMFTEGLMYIDWSGKVKDEEDETIDIECNFNNYTIGELYSYKIEETYEIQTKSKKGDVNQDGVIDSADASMALYLYTKAISGSEFTDEEKKQAEQADINGDGIVDTSDSSLIISYYSGLMNGFSQERIEKIIKCDFNKSYSVNVEDYNLLESAIKNQKYDSKFDLNEDGKLDNNDIKIFKEVILDNGFRMK